MTSSFNECDYIPTDIYKEHVCFEIAKCITGVL